MCPQSVLDDPPLPRNFLNTWQSSFKPRALLVSPRLYSLHQHLQEHVGASTPLCGTQLQLQHVQYAKKATLLHPKCPIKVPGIPWTFKGQREDEQ